MSLLFSVLSAWKCHGTHHQLAMQAVRRLRGPDADAWRNLFLSQLTYYLAGSQAPDDEFHDYRNHVLHVRENYWGGAVAAVEDWYAHTVAALKKQDWPAAVYAAGVMSHYFTDPHMPLHTGQSEEEGAVHRALERSVAKSFDDLLRAQEEDLGGYPDVEVPAGADWLSRMLRQGADLANAHYEALIDHYDLARGVADPSAGLDQECMDRLAPLLGRAVAGLARVLEQAFHEAGVHPRNVYLTPAAVYAGLTLPVTWFLKTRREARERDVIAAIYREYRQTGKVVEALPPDEKLVRRLHAAEVLRLPMSVLNAQPARPVGTQAGGGTPSRPTLRLMAPAEVGPRFYLTLDRPAAEAPSIEMATAQKLGQIGVKTVADLLALHPDEVAPKLGAKDITADVLRDYQAQAWLVCRVPCLRGPDARLLVACGVRDPEELAHSSVDDLLALAEEAAGDGPKPDRGQIAEWIARSQPGRIAKAA
ncbi:MAG: DUF4332 domain-containing protein [Gemmataceae bacterium]